jgi:hypothetical protein
VTKMPPQVDKILTGSRGGQNVTKVGYPVGSLHGLINLGLFNTENVNNPNLHGWFDAPKVPGTKIYKDTNGDGIVNLNDMVVIGNPHPKIIFGFNNQFSYRNISLSVLLSGMLGYQVMRRYFDVLLNTVARYNVSTLELHRWKSPQDPGNGFVPRAAVNNGAREWSNTWLSPGGHLWVKNVRLSYQLPEKIVQSIGLKKLGFYTSINNVALFTNYDGFNPEVSSSTNPLNMGIDSFVYPLSRLYTFGINFTF